MDTLIGEAPKGDDEKDKIVHDMISKICDSNEIIGNLCILGTSLSARLPANKHTEPMLADLRTLVQEASSAASELSERLSQLVDSRDVEITTSIMNEAHKVATQFTDEYNSVEHMSRKWAAPLKPADADHLDDDKTLDELCRHSEDDGEIDERKLFEKRKNAKRERASGSSGVAKRQKKQRGAVHDW